MRRVNIEHGNEVVGADAGDGSPVRLQFLGGGRMAAALLGGLIETGWCQTSDVHVVEPDPVAQRRLVDTWSGLSVGDSPTAALGTVVAVKPGLAAAVLEHARAAGVGRVLSLAAGVTLGALEAVTEQGTPVVRSMPNTPALVGRGVAAISAGVDATENDMAWAEALLGAVGTVVRLPEHLLDAVTGLSGSGPAYMFLVAESLIDAGVTAGLNRDIATTLAVETMMGAAMLMVESGKTPADLRADVTSPGGTTAAGLRVLERDGVRSAFIEAVAAATARSKELGA